MEDFEDFVLTVLVRTSGDEELRNVKEQRKPRRMYQRLLSSRLLNDCRPKLLSVIRYDPNSYCASFLDILIYF